jgi:hypothetical protein
MPTAPLPWTHASTAWPAKPSFPTTRDGLQTIWRTIPTTK